MVRAVLILSILVTTACQMDASIVSVNVQAPSFPAKVTGVVPGSVQSGYVGSPSAPTYRVQASVGATTSHLRQVTSDGNYVVYSSVQGAIVAD